MEDWGGEEGERRQREEKSGLGNRVGGRHAAGRQVRSEVGFKNDDVSDFPVGPVAENPPANAGDMGSILGLGKFHIPWGN